MKSILNQAYSHLDEKSVYTLKDLYILKVLFGVNMTYVELSDKSIGIASTLHEKQTKPHKKFRHYGEFSPSKYSGQKVSDLFHTKVESDLVDTLKIAVLNALSSKQRESSGYKIIENTDPIDLIKIISGQKITLVGAFRSYIDYLSEFDIELKVLELNEDIFCDEHKKFYVPANEYKDILPKSDIVIVTGLTLINNTIDGILDSINPESKLIVVGPSANILPQILFDNGADIIGATKYSNPELLFKLISEGASAYHLFEYCAQKICIIND